LKRGIFLVGFSGSGKSTIAKIIGERLGWPTYDLDDMIVEQSGLTIPAIFEREGEHGFRLREASALRAASLQDSFVIATGGGAIAQLENRAYMESKGWMICLEARAETILERIQSQITKSEANSIRPLLQVTDSADNLEQIQALKLARQSAYSLAHCTVHTDGLTVDQVVSEVIRAAEQLSATLGS
jgi:shikimate kinase